MQGRLTGKKIENYVFNYSDFLGQGNFSKCYKATNQHTGRQVAIKIVELNSLKSKKLEQLLYSQIEILKEIDHPNLLKCHQVFTSNRNCYIITELCDQGDLETLLQKGPPLTPTVLCNVIADVYKGLRYLDGKKIIHRDLKIANVFIHQGLSKIADFGFAVHYQGNFKDYNIGSPLYMSPEGFLENVYGAKTDIWAFGIMVYELYHGHTPFHHCKTEAELKQSVLKPLQSHQFRPDLSIQIKELILLCLQVNENKRSSIRDLMSRSSWLQRIVGDREMQLGAREINSPLKSKKNIPERKRPQMLNFNEVNQIFTMQARTPQRESSLLRQVRMNSSMEEEGRFKKPVMFNFTSASPQKKAFFNTSSPQVVTHTVNSPINASVKPPLRNNFMNTSSPADRRVDVLSRERNGSLSPHFQSPKKPTNGIRSPFVANETILVHSSRGIDERERYLIGGQINFKQSVTLLHYCRLLYKHLHCLKDLTGLQQQRERAHYAAVGHFLLHCIDEMLMQISGKRIIYQGDQPELRQRKLKQVTQQYHKKYRQDLDQGCMQMGQPQGTTLETIGGSCLQVLNSLWIQEGSSQSVIICGELLLVIHNSSSVLHQCKQTKEYHRLDHYRQIENVLNKSKEEFTYQDFLNLKKRLNASL